MRTNFRRLLCAATLGLSWSGLAAAQNVGTIAGTVSDRSTNQPIASAQVVIVGTNLGTLTNTQGEYSIGSLRAGTYQVRVLRLGYQSTTQTTAVDAGGTSTLNFTLQPSAVALDAVVVTATGEEQRARERGNSVPIITMDSVNLAPIPNLSDLL
jgi:hypothetical protein